jgi:hypothetical protein
MLRWFRKLGLLSSAFALVALLFASNVGCASRTHHHHHHRGVKRGHHKANKPRPNRGKKKGHARAPGQKKGKSKGKGKGRR